jgi:hypothetical protein
MIAKIIPEMIDGIASTSITLKIICILDAPKDFAASINAGSTSFRLLSKILPIKGTQATVKGTIAATSPIEEPTTNLVKGIIAIIKIINGKERITFTKISSTLLRTGQGHNPSLGVMTNTTPTKNPKKTDKTPEKHNIFKVFPIAGIINI